MRAAVFRSAAGRLVLEDVPEPVPGPHEVLLRIARVGICGSELHYTADPAKAALTNGILGHEICGEVVALGAGVTRLRIGDRIAPMPFVGCGFCRECLNGLPHRCPQGRMDVVRGFCGFTRASEFDCALLAPEVSDEEGALIEPLAVGLRGVRQAGIEPGARVLVTGAGPIGLAAALWAERLGAGRVAVLAGSTRRRALALGLGASHFLALADCTDPAAAVRDALGGPPDAVIEAVGLPGAIAAAIDCVKTGGVVVSLGLCTTDDSFRPEIATMKEVRLLFSLCSARQDFHYVAEVLAAGERRPRALITRRIGLGALPAVFEGLRAPSADCKVMVAPWDD